MWNLLELRKKPGHREDDDIGGVRMENGSGGGFIMTDSSGWLGWRTAGRIISYLLSGWWGLPGSLILKG